MAEVDVDRLWVTIDKMARHTGRIPGLERKVEATGEKVVELSTEMQGMGRRVTKIEDKVDRGHDCFQVDVIAEVKDNQREAGAKIEKDILKGVQTKAALDGVVRTAAAIEADVEIIKAAPRRMFYGLLGIVATIVIGAGGAIWFLAQLERDVDFERTQRVDQFKRIEDQIRSVGNKSNTAPVTRALESLEDEIEESNGHAEAYNQLCDGMTRHEIRFMKNTLIKRGKRIPLTCLE